MRFCPGEKCIHYGEATFIMLQQSKIYLYEPNRPILMAEFGMAVVWTLMGLFFLGVAIREARRKTVKK